MPDIICVLAKGAIMKMAQSLQEETGPVPLRHLLGQVTAAEQNHHQDRKRCELLIFQCRKQNLHPVLLLAAPRNKKMETHKRRQQSAGTACPGEITKERKKGQKLNHS